MAKQECFTEYTVCLSVENYDTIDHFQTFVKKRERKTTFNKSQAINRIIKEWAEDRCLTLEVAKKMK